ncbi:MAG: phage tail sheath family protein [Lachnospiraceae bacterium]|nr:phage tail sheath family protein [Lachnospiraceae bacterium]
MALGGGTWLTQNKVLPGAYINFISAATATATLGDRGYAAMGLEMDWGEESKIIEITNGDFQKDSLKIFGYSYADDHLKGLRELFANIKTLYAYRLTSGGVKSESTYAVAKYCGTRGNAIKNVIAKNVDDNTKWDVDTYFDDTLIDSQTVADSTELVANDYVTFKNGVALAATAGLALTGGTNGTVNATSHQNFLAAIEAFPSINAIGYVGDTSAIANLYSAFAKRMRDEVGVKFQAVLYNTAADYEGVVNVMNTVTDAGASAASLVYWVTGVIAGTLVNASASNKVYDGEFTVDTNYTQSQLEAAIKAGKFALHQVGTSVRVLDDINSLVTTTANKGDVFKDNQTIRVCDQIATDIANLFVTKYLGVVPNDKAGRVSLWADIVKHHEQLEKLRAIEDFEDKDVVVSQGDTKKAVVVDDVITVVNAMTKLYMTVTVQ